MSRQVDALGFANVRMKCNGANLSNHSKQTALQNNVWRDTLENARPLVKLAKPCKIGANYSQNWCELLAKFRRMPLFYLLQVKYGNVLYKKTRHNSPKHPKETIKQCIPAKNSANITAKRSFSQKFQYKSSKSNQAFVQNIQ